MKICFYSNTKDKGLINDSVDEQNIEFRPEKYLQCSSDSACNSLTLIDSKNLCHTKICNPGIHFPIQQNIACFKITVDNSETGIFVKIKETSSNPPYDFVTT